MGDDALGGALLEDLPRDQKRTEDPAIAQGFEDLPTGALCHCPGDAARRF